MGVNNLNGNLIYNKQLSKPSDNYIAVDNDHSSAYKFLSDSIIRKQGRFDKAAELDLAAKTEYQKLAKTFEVADLSKANQMINDYTRKQAESYLSGNDPDPASIMRSSGDLLYSPQFTDMLRRGEYMKTQQNIADTLRMNGKTDVMFNDDIRNQSLYNSDGTKNDVQYEKVKAAEVLNYNKSMQDVLETITSSQWEDVLTPSEIASYYKAGTHKGLSVQTLERASEKLFDSYLGSSAGQNQLQFLTSHSDRNKNPLATKEQAFVQMKEEFKNVAKSKAYQEDSFKYEVNHDHVEGLKNKNAMQQINAKHNSKMKEIQYKQQLKEQNVLTENRTAVDLNLKTTSGRNIPFTGIGKPLLSAYNQIPNTDVYNQNGIKINVTTPIKGTVGQVGYIYKYKEKDENGVFVEKVYGSDNKKKPIVNVVYNPKDPNNPIKQYFFQREDGVRVKVEKVAVKNVLTTDGKHVNIELDENEKLMRTGESNYKAFSLDNTGSFNYNHPEFVNKDLPNLVNYANNTQNQELVDAINKFQKYYETGIRIPASEREKVQSIINLYSYELKKQEADRMLIEEQTNKDINKKKISNEYKNPKESVELTEEEIEDQIEEGIN